MTSQSAKLQAVKEIYEPLRFAAARKPPVTAVYDNQPRLRCPHVLGRKSGRFHAFVYPFGGRSKRDPPMMAGRAGWRCLTVEELSQVELRADAWHTEPRSPRQTCIDEIDFDADAQPGGDPQ